MREEKRRRVREEWGVQGDKLLSPRRNGRSRLKVDGLSHHAPRHIEFTRAQIGHIDGGVIGGGAGVEAADAREGAFGTSSGLGSPWVIVQSLRRGAAKLLLCHAILRTLRGRARKVVAARGVGAAEQIVRAALESRKASIRRAARLVVESRRI